MNSRDATFDDKLLKPQPPRKLQRQNTQTQLMLLQADVEKNKRGNGRKMKREYQSLSYFGLSDSAEELRKNACDFRLIQKGNLSDAGSQEDDEKDAEFTYPGASGGYLTQMEVESGTEERSDDDKTNHHSQAHPH